MFTAKSGWFWSDGGAGTQFGRENEPHICEKQYSSGPDTKERKKERK